MRKGKKKIMAESEKDVHLKNLPPSEISLKDIQDPNQKEIAQKLIDEWANLVLKDISSILEKHGVKQWELGFLHVGTRTPIIFSRGGSYITCKLAAYAVRELKARVDKELAIE